MADDKKGDELPHAPERGGSDNRDDSTLLPMLIFGLVLIVIGAMVVMIFV